MNYLEIPITDPETTFTTLPRIYKVFKIGRKSGRRTIIGKGLTEPEAQRLVKQYPNSSRSMVCYTRM